MKEPISYWVVLAIAILSIPLAVEVIWKEPFILATITLYGLFVVGMILGAGLITTDSRVKAFWDRFRRP